MIDLTPLDVRKKRGDFRRAMRGYDPAEVDPFLELVSERLEELVKENLALQERVDRLAEQVGAQEGREKAVHEALVTAQELRDEIRTQARSEADLARREAELEARGIVERAEEAARRTHEEAERILAEGRRELRELERARARFLKGLRGMLERQMDALEVEEERVPSSEFPDGVVDVPEGNDGVDRTEDADESERSVVTDASADRDEELETTP